MIFSINFTILFTANITSCFFCTGCVSTYMSNYKFNACCCTFNSKICSICSSAYSFINNIALTILIYNLIVVICFVKSIYNCCSYCFTITRPIVCKDFYCSFFITAIIYTTYCNYIISCSISISMI